MPRALPPFVLTADRLAQVTLGVSTRARNAVVRLDVVTERAAGLIVMDRMLRLHLGMPRCCFHWFRPFLPVAACVYRLIQRQDLNIGPGGQTAAIACKFHGRSRVRPVNQEGRACTRPSTFSLRREFGPGESPSDSRFQNSGEAPVVRIRAAGFEPNQVQTTWRRWTISDLLAEIRAASTNGLAPTPKTTDPAHYYRLVQTAIRFYGTWGAACGAAGVKPAGRVGSVSRYRL